MSISSALKGEKTFFLRSHCLRSWHFCYLCYAKEFIPVSLFEGKNLGLVVVSALPLHSSLLSACQMSLEMSKQKVHLLALLLEGHQSIVG